MKWEISNTHCMVFENMCPVERQSISVEFAVVECNCYRPDVRRNGGGKTSVKSTAAVATPQQCGKT